MKPKIGSDKCDCCDGSLGDTFQLVTNAICKSCSNAVDVPCVRCQSLSEEIETLQASVNDRNRRIVLLKQTLNRIRVG